MASVYSKRKILYISWFDWSLGKTKNRSTKLNDSPTKRRTVEKMAKELQAELDKKKEEFAKKFLIKGATIKSAFEHFKLLNSTKDWKTIKDYNRFFDLFK